MSVTASITTKQFSVRTFVRFNMRPTASCCSITIHDDSLASRRDRERQHLTSFGDKVILNLIEQTTFNGDNQYVYMQQEKIFVRTNQTGLLPFELRHPDNTAKKLHVSSSKRHPSFVKLFLTQSLPLQEDRGLWKREHQYDNMCKTIKGRVFTKYCSFAIVHFFTCCAHAAFSLSASLFTISVALQAPRLPN